MRASRRTHISQTTYAKLVKSKIKTMPTKMSVVCWPVQKAEGKKKAQYYAILTFPGMRRYFGIGTTHANAINTAFNNARKL